MSLKIIIEQQCPQCGAPLLLEESDRLFTCRYCHVRSYLVAPGLLKYVLPQNAPEGPPLVFFPYWRFKGTLFSIAADAISCRFIDTSQRAVKTRLFPPSVGLRSQALKLRYLSSDDAGRFLKPTLSLRETMLLFREQFFRQPVDDVFHWAAIGESTSLIFSPFYVADRIYDAVLNRPLESPLP